MGHLEDRKIRRAAVAAAMEDNSFALLFSGTRIPQSEDHDYPFSVNRNFYYLTGCDRENQILLISKRNGKISETLFTPKTNPDLEKWVGFYMTPETVKSLSHIDDVQPRESFENILGRMLSWQNLQYCYLDFDQNQLQQEPISPSHRFANTIQRNYPGLTIRNLHYTLSQMRLIKSSAEIEEIRKAIAVTNEAIQNLWAHSQPGMKEYQLEAYFDFTLRSHGVSEHAFPPIVASGERATILHYVSNDLTAEDGELVLLDLGASSGYYAADISRTFPVNGKFSERQKAIYEAVLEAEEKVIAAVRPGVTWSELNQVAKDSLAESLVRLGIAKSKDEIDEYYYHSVGHPLGLDTHDVGDRDVPLAPGMVITIEPGLYIAKEKIGIRIEDDIWVTENGHEVLSQAIPKTVSEIEQLVGKHRQ